MTGKSRKRFATLSSGGPDISNLQLNFWRLAVSQFRNIEQKWRAYATDDDPTSFPPYEQNDFKVDAAAVIVLAGTSVAELVGQNVESKKGRTPAINVALGQLLGCNAPPGAGAFIDIYDAIRHFGDAKHDTVGNLTEDDLCAHMTTAQSIWVAVLEKSGLKVTDEFRYQFALS